MLKLIQGNCLDVMATLPAGCVDMVLCDLPYGTTACKWDSVIPFEPLWREYRRLCKGAIVLTASQPFTSALVMSQASAFKYEWIWRKAKPVGHLNAKKRPMQAHESVVVFSYGSTPYSPQGLVEAGDIVTRTNNGAYRECSKPSVRTHTGYPRSVLDYPHDKSVGHPTQKPVALMEYMVKTYTDPGDVVLDNTMGSGTTGVACMNTGRGFIGIELDEGYFQIAKSRIEAAMPVPEWLK